MFVHVGSKIIRKHAGATGHFCPICREITLFRTSSVHRTITVYFMPVDGGKHLCDEMICTQCSVLLGFTPGQIMAIPGDGAEGEYEVSEVAASTSPWGTEGLMDRLDLESRLHGGAISAEERRALIAEPLTSLEYLATNKVKGGAQESITSVLAFVAIAGVVATVFMWYEYVQTYHPTTGFTAACVAVSAATIFLFAFLMYRMATDRRRAGRNYLLQPLIKALAPIRPRDEEVRSALLDLRRSRKMLARMVHPDDLINGLRQTGGLG